ncbi:hypothetical protein TNIN_258951, partial [Trichonephila inaurata madagascariensis]
MGQKSSGNPFKSKRRGKLEGKGLEGSSLVASGTWEPKSGQSSSREPPSALCK